MSSRAEEYVARVLRRTQIAPHLVRLTLGGAGMAGFTSTGVPDEWVGLVVPGQFQSRYYTVRRWSDGELVLDVVLHDEGLVTAWVAGDCVGDDVTVTAARGSFDPPPDAGWVLLVGDLTALPAIARIAESTTLPTRAWAEVPDDPAALAGYLPDRAEVTWLASPATGGSGLAEAVTAIDWPSGAGYFWMAGESAQMRAIRKHLMRDRGLPGSAYDVMGYWRAGSRQPRAIDPRPVWQAGRAAGLTDEQIWAAYDGAVESAERGQGGAG